MINCQAQKMETHKKIITNNKIKIDTKGIELLPTMTRSYDITGHVTGRGELKAGVIWRDIFYLQISRS